MMKVLITGANGFIAKNLALRLSELKDLETIGFNRSHSLIDLEYMVNQSDVIFHIAGVNRPIDPHEFIVGNLDLTEQLCRLIEATGRKIPMIVSSSAQSSQKNPYGHSKRAAEAVCEDFATRTKNPVVIFRLPGVFGKWSRPNYNSVVATFCHNIANDLPIQINDPSAVVRLVYIDDVIDAMLKFLQETPEKLIWEEIQPVYEISLNDLANQIYAFKNCRSNLISERVGTGLTRALYSTYVSYLDKKNFVYDVPKYGDSRGVFVEMLKTKDSGQFSFFTAHPGITRGGHYHHSKTEKFLVIKGQARFGFRHMITNERFEIVTSGEIPQIVETVPGWTHDITNIGNEEMIVILWANEIFDREKPDTIPASIRDVKMDKSSSLV